MRTAFPSIMRTGHVTVKEESWVTDASTDPYGSPETEGASHMLARLPVGAYILEEREAPLEQGYIRAEFMGLVLEDTEEVQKFFCRMPLPEPPLPSLTCGLRGR